MEQSSKNHAETPVAQASCLLFDASDELIGVDGPVTGIRLEQARERVGDFEYLRLLADRIQDARRGGNDVNGANRILEMAAHLAAIPNAGGRYSSKILASPQDLDTTRSALAAAIESLSP